MSDVVPTSRRRRAARQRLLILTADDFGLTAGANLGIQKAHEAGGLTATTVLVGGVAADEAGELPRRWPELDVGLHVNLTLGSPTAEPSTVRSLLGSDGRFLPADQLRARALRRRVRGEEVRREVEAQFRRLRQLGVEATHWDAHQQVAFWPGLIGPTAAAAWSSGMRRARTPRMRLLAFSSPEAARRWNWRLRHPRRLLTDAQRAAAAARLSRRFALPGWQLAPDLVLGEESLEARWRLLLSRPPTGVSEAVSHPAIVDEELRLLVPRFADRRATDLAVLTDPALPARLRSAGVTLLGFRSLPV